MSDTPITVSVLKDLLREQTDEGKKHLDELKKTLKDEIKKSEEQVKQHIEEQLMEVRSDVDGLKETVKENKEEIQDMKKENDREKRSRNLIIFKIPEEESNGIQLKYNVKALILDNCKVDISNHIDKIYRIGRAEPTKIRPILLALTSLDKKMEIFWGKKHHGAKLELAEDYSPDVLAARRNLVPVLKELRELKYEDVHIRQDKLYVGGTVCEEERWNELIKDREPNVPSQDSRGTGAKRKETSPKGNDIKRPHTSSLTVSAPPTARELCPQKPENTRDYLKFNQKIASSPIAKYLSKTTVADGGEPSKTTEKELNQTIR